MSFPIIYSNGSPNFAYNGATVVIPPALGAYGLLELEARPNRNLYVDSFTVVHGPDCQLFRLFSSVDPPGTSAIDDNLVTFPISGLESLQGVLLTTGILRYGTTIRAPLPQEESFIVPSRQKMPPMSDAIVREFHQESFGVPLHIPPGTTGAVCSTEANKEVRLGIRWFEQPRSLA